MTEPHPRILRHELLASAERLFNDAPFVVRPVADAARELHESTIPSIAYAAVRAEVARAKAAEHHRIETARAAWVNRSLGTVITNALRGQGYLQVVGSFNPRPNITHSLTRHTRKLAASLPLGTGWPSLPVTVEQWGFDGSLTINDQTFRLESSATSLSVALDYPLSDGTRTDHAVTFTSYPYADEVRTATYQVFGDYWHGVPHQPFADEPAPPSILMNRALEMLADR